MHTDQRAADVKTCMGADLLDRNGIFHICPGDSRKRTACFGLGNDGNDLIAVLFCGFAFHDDRAVQMLTALRAEINACFGKNRCDTRIGSLCALNARIVTDRAACDFAGRAADDEQGTGL